jgi:hypothetical protein
LRASLRDLSNDWLVRVHRQRASLQVYAVVDVSASMAFGAPQDQAASRSGLRRSGSAKAPVASAMRVGMLAFDAEERADLFVPAVVRRGIGALMASVLRQAETAARGFEGLEAAVQAHRRAAGANFPRLGFSLAARNA